MDRKKLWAYFVPFYLTMGLICRLVEDLRSDPATLSDHANSWLRAWIAPYYFGSLFSEWFVIRWPATIAAVVVVATSAHPSWRHAPRAKTGIGWVFWTSIVTLWFEPWLSLVNVGIGVAIASLAPGLMKMAVGFWLNVAVTVAWAISAMAWCDSIDREWPQLEIETKS